MEIELDEILKEGIAETVQVHRRYNDGTDELTDQTDVSALVQLESPVKEYDDGERHITNGKVWFAVTDLTKVDLEGRGTVTDSDYDVEAVHLVIRGAECSIEAVGHPVNGMIEAVVKGVSHQYSNTPATESIV